MRKLIYLAVLLFLVLAVRASDTNTITIYDLDDSVMTVTNWWGGYVTYEQRQIFTTNTFLVLDRKGSNVIAWAECWGWNTDYFKVRDGWGWLCARQEFEDLLRP